VACSVLRMLEDIDVCIVVFVSFCGLLGILLLFRHICKIATSVISCVMPVCLSLTTWLTQDRLAQNLMFGVFSENMLRKFKFR
jgi:hypothetical protein